MPRLPHPALPLVLVLLGLAPLGAQSFGDAVSQFEANFYTADEVNKIALKGQAIMALPTNDKRYVDLMYSVIDRAETWYDVGCAFQYFTNIHGEVRARLAKDLYDRKAKHSSRVRVAIAYQLYDYAKHFRKLEDAEYEAVLRGIKDKDPGVRRFCALALQLRPEQTAVDALLAAWGDEKDQGVITAFVETLRQLTGKDKLSRDLQEWNSWREGNPEPELAMGFDPAEDQVGTYADLELQFDMAETGSGLPMMVLPPQGYTNRIYRPGLDVLEDVARLIYIRLPVVGQDIEIPKDEDGNELYPVEMLVESLEELRAELKEEKVVLLGCQDTSWIVLRYAQLHPEHVAALIIVSGWLETEDFAASLELLKMHGTEEEKLYVEVASGLQLLQNLGQSQQQSVTVGKLASLHREPTDVNVCYVWETIIDMRSQGRVLIVPQAPLDSKKKIEVPALIVHGKEDRWSAIKYTSYGGRKYLKPRPKVVEIPGSGPLPWLDNPAEFHKQVEKFLSKLK